MIRSDLVDNKLTYLSGVLLSSLRETDCYNQAIESFWEEYSVNDDEKITISFDSIFDFLEPQKWGWKYEIPPLAWLSCAFVYWMHLCSMPISILVKLVKALQYYGCNDTSILVIKSNNFLNEMPFTASNELAKAYKNKGALVDSLNIYRNSLSVAVDSKNELQITGLFLLLAKLYEDLGINKGLYASFIEISYKRIMKIDKQKYGEGYYNFWKNMCQDTYALLPKHDFKYSNKELEKLIKIGGHGDVANRYKIHKAFLELKHSLNSSFIDIKSLENSFEQCEGIINNIKHRNNIKAKVVRQIQFLSLLREVVSFCQIKSIPYPRICQVYLGGRAAHVLSEIYDDCKLISDVKFAMMASYELGKWIMLGESSDKSIIKSIYWFEEALKIPHNAYYLSDIRYDILVDMAHLYISLCNWNEAIKSLNKAHQLLETLLMMIESDEALINDILCKRRSICNNTEFSYLTNKELRIVRRSLSVDYKTLLSHLLVLSKKLLLLKDQKISDKIIEMTKLSRTFQYHNIQRRLNELERDAVSGYDLSPRITELKTYFADLIAKDNIHSLELIDLVEATSSILSNDLTISKFSCTGKILCRVSEVPKVMFNEEILRIILQTYLENVHKIANDRNKNNYFAIIKFVAEYDHIYIQIKDNCGSSDDLERAVTSINDNVSMDYTFTGSRGNGFKLIKSLIRSSSGVNSPWIIRRHSPIVKSLFIPITARNY